MVGFDVVTPAEKLAFRLCLDEMTAFSLDETVIALR
jgi:hypothetical protein